jgi:hypothetical protein
MTHALAHKPQIISQGTLQISAAVRQQYSEAFNKLWDMAAQLVSSKVGRIVHIFFPRSAGRHTRARIYLPPLAGVARSWHC